MYCVPGLGSSESHLNTLAVTHWHMTAYHTEMETWHIGPDVFFSPRPTKKKIRLGLKTTLQVHGDQDKGPE